MGSYHYYIKRDLGNPNFSPTTIFILLFSCTYSGVHIFKLTLYISRTYEFTYSYIFIFIPSESNYREISKFLIWFHRISIVTSWDFYLELSGAIWANMSLRSRSNASSFIQENQNRFLRELSKIREHVICTVQVFK